jgi:hypothetical protein
MTRLPSGTVTFLFTDIEGSTKLAWEVARGQYHHIVRRAVENFTGPDFYRMRLEVSSPVTSVETTGK